MNGNSLTTYNTTLTGNIIQIEWFQQGFGVLDSNNVYSIFRSNGTLAGSTPFNSSLKVSVLLKMAILYLGQLILAPKQHNLQ